MKVSIVLLGSVFLFNAGVALAQDSQQKALARAQYMLKQVSAEKNALQVKNTELAQELESIKSKLDTEMAKAEKNEKKLKSNLNNWKGEYQSLKERFLQTSVVLRETTEQRNNLQQGLALQTKNFSTCFNHNHQLVGLNSELLSQFSGKGVWDALSQKEPIVGLGKVAIENLVQQYKFDIEDLSLGMNQHLIEEVELQDSQKAGEGSVHE